MSIMSKLSTPEEFFEESTTQIYDAIYDQAFIFYDEEELEQEVDETEELDDEIGDELVPHFDLPGMEEEAEA